MNDRMMCLYEITDRKTVFPTQYGLITQEEWLEKEAKRIGKQPGRIVRIEGLKLFVNRIAG